jgi:uncharacterized protein YbjT (DUF2867 family)
VETSGVPFVILRPGALSDEAGRGTIVLATERGANPLPVSRDDVARVAVECVQRGLSGDVIGFVGGDEPIGRALDEIQTAPTSR